VIARSHIALTIHLTWPLGFSKRKLCTKFKVSSSSNFKDMFDCMPKILGVTWPRPRPFWGKLFERPLGFSKRKLCTKFEVSSWSNFEDIFDCMPKSLGVMWPRPCPCALCVYIVLCVHYCLCMCVCVVSVVWFVFCSFLQYFDTVGWVFWPVKPSPI